MINGQKKFDTIGTLFFKILSMAVLTNIIIACQQSHRFKSDIPVVNLVSLSHFPKQFI